MMKRISRALLLSVALFALPVTACTQQQEKSTTEEAEQTQQSPMIVKSKVVKVIDFNAVWCGPCRQMAPIFEKLKKKYEGKIEFVSIDVDQNREMAQQYNVRAVPTFVFFTSDGNTFVQEGSMTEAQFESLLAK